MKRTGAIILIMICITSLALPGGSRELKNKKKPPVKRADDRKNYSLAREPAVILGGMKITLGDAIRQAVERNYTIIAGSYDVAMTDTAYSMFKKKYTPVLSLEAGAAYIKNLPSMQLFAGIDAKQIDAAASIYKSFSSGTTVIAGLKHEYTALTRDRSIDLILPGMSSALGPAHAQKPSLFVSIQQELLKNAFGFNDRKLKKILKNAEKMKREAILFQLSMVVVGVIADYWTVVVNKASMDNARLLVRETRKVRNITANNVRYGMADSFNLNYYNALLAGAEAGLVQARQKYRDSLRDFLTTINMDEKMNVSGTAIFSDTYSAIDLEEALKKAYTQRADYRNALLAVENAKMDLSIKKNERLPSIIAELNAATNAENSSTVRAYRDMGRGKYPAIEGRIKLTYPLWDKSLSIKERNARFRLKQATINRDRLKRQVRDDIIKKIEMMKTAHTLYKKTRKASRQSSLFYRKMLASLRRGRLNAALVKNGVDALVQSRQQELMALVYYNVSRLQFTVAENELFEKYNIDVNKYIPK